MVALFQIQTMDCAKQHAGAVTSTQGSRRLSGGRERGKRKRNKLEVGEDTDTFRVNLGTHKGGREGRQRAPRDSKQYFSLPHRWVIFSTHSVRASLSSNFDNRLEVKAAGKTILSKSPNGLKAVRDLIVPVCDLLE